jgi:peptidoglycan hydrolase-like protein with peptidoglycan-binding domain
MSTYELTAPPASAGAAILSGFLSLILWSLGRIWRAPLASACVIALTVGIAYAASNALYLQDGEHPAPYFTAEPQLVAPVIAPSPESARPAAVETAPASVEEVMPASDEVTGGVSQATRAEVIGNEEVAAMQEKLAALGLYEDTVDGYYGPATASAIRAFETREGLNPVGALTPVVIELILSAPMGNRPQAIDTPPATAAPVDGTGQSASLPVVPETTAPEVLVAETEIATASAVQAEEVTIFDPLEALTRNVAANATGNGAEPELTTNEELVSKVQRGLASLGFLHGTTDGVAGESTARAIRNFEVYYNYEVTGEVSPELVDLLVNAGASI